MKIKNRIFFALGLILFFLFYFSVKPVFNQTNEFSSNSAPIELMEQGKIRTCLSAKFLKEIERRSGVQSRTPISVKGTCESPIGCKCVMNWGFNKYVAETNSKTWEGCDRQKDDILSELKKNVKKFTRLLKAGGNANVDDYVRGKSNQCSKTIRESSNPILASLKPGFKECNIIKNNLANSASIVKDSSKQNILGVTDSGLIPPGPVDLVVEETTYIHTPVDFAAVGELPAVTTTEDVETGRGGVTGEDASQKLGRLEFIAQQLKTIIDNLKTNCSSITWDPYGRIFDAQSLEPISDVEVTLIDDTTKKPAEMTFNLNYDITGEDGVFNIQVEKEGNYQLMIKSFTNHQFLDNPILNPNWSNIYSDLYLPNKVFFEKQGVPTHHDIPLQSKDTPYKEAIAEIVPGTMKSENFGDYIVYRGRQTFPMAKVCLINEETGLIVDSCTNANNIGSFVLVVPRVKIPQDSNLKLIPEKVDLTDSSIYKNKEKEVLHMNSLVTAGDPKRRSYTFEPILNYIEGYAYDNSGQKIPEAKIQVRFLMNDNIFYETKADDSGFFTIYTNNLPYIEYYLKFINPKTNEELTKTTSEFVKDNKAYLNGEKINLMAGTKYDQPIVDPKTGKLNQIDKNYQPSQSTSEKAQTEGKPAFNKNMFMIVLILLVLFVSVIGVAFYIKKTRTGS